MAQVQPGGRDESYNKKYWDAVQKEMEDKGKPKPPPFGNWKPLGDIKPYPPGPQIVPPPKYDGKNTRRDK